MNGALWRLLDSVFETYLLAICILTGTLGLAVPAARSRSIVASFPGPLQAGWYAALALSGVVGLVGIIIGAELGHLIERAGLLVLAGLCCSFGAAAISLSGLAGIPGSGMLIGYGLACLTWALRVPRVIRTQAAASQYLCGQKR